MRIVHDSPSELLLRGRRTDGEDGEPGLWLLWLIGAAMAGGGVLFAAVIDDVSARWMGRALIGFGIAIIGFGLHRSARRESLRIDRTAHTIMHSTRHWPRRATPALEADIDTARRVELERRTEGASGPHDRAAHATEVWRVRLVLAARKRIELVRTKDEASARKMAHRVADALDVPVDDRGR